jgi:FkbM family methyltransferase
MINFSAPRPHTVIGKLLRYPFRVVPQGICIPILQGPLRGKKWIAGSHLHGCWLGSYELETQTRITKELKRGEVFYDVGANVGFYSLLAAVLTEPGLVYAFEPLPANLVFLKRHLELNNMQEVNVFEVAISDEVGTACFEAEKSRAMGKLQGRGDLQVSTSTLDALVSDGKIIPPNFIKMDIEGSEFDALIGAKVCFARYRPKLYLSTHGPEVHNECYRLLSSWDYHIQLGRGQQAQSDLFALPRRVQDTA